MFKNICFILFLFKGYLFFIQKINKETKLNNNDYLSLKKGDLYSALEQPKIYGNINELNYYYVNLYLGKDKKKQSFLLDTGSGITSIPCKPYCNQCGIHLNSYLYVKENQIIDCDNEKCSSVESECNKENNYCSFKVHYSENSNIRGIYINEIIDFNNNGNNQLIPIGCTTYEDNFFYTQKVDGIMGLCNNGQNLINLLYKYGIINNNIFSLCFEQKGGYMSIDEIETKYHKEKIKYININKDNYYYSFNIDSIAVNNKTISSEKYMATIDSGLTLTKMPINIINIIINYIINLCDKGNKRCGQYFIHKELGSCYKFNSSKELYYVVNNIWPNITFLINDYDYVWKPSQYLFKFIENENIIGCFGFIKNSANIINLGASWMIGHDIIFDNQNNKIGFTEADCNQRDSSNNGEEEVDIPLYNDNINIIDNNYGKKIFILYIIIISILIVTIIFLCFYIFYLKKGKKILCNKNKTNIEEEFYKNNINQNKQELKNDINKDNDKFFSFIEMNNNYTQ